uniref:Uncharacterized protein n=1 Tax=Ditylenchus dipsaci TaxID=166011 RepID=A0A915DAR2_9BILA
MICTEESSDNRDSDAAHKGQAGCNEKFGGQLSNNSDERKGRDIASNMRQIRLIQCAILVRKPSSSEEQILKLVTDYTAVDPLLRQRLPFFRYIQTHMAKLHPPMPDDEVEVVVNMPVQDPSQQPQNLGT